MKKLIVVAIGLVVAGGVAVIMYLGISLLELGKLPFKSHSEIKQSQSRQYTTEAKAPTPEDIKQAEVKVPPDVKAISKSANKVAVKNIVRTLESAIANGNKDLEAALVTNLKSYNTDAIDVLRQEKSVVIDQKIKSGLESAYSEIIGRK